MEYLKPFLIGGLVISGSKFVSTFASPEIAPLIGGAPTGIIASYFLQNDDARRKFFSGYSVSAPILALAIVIINYMLNMFPEVNTNIISTLGLFIWAIVSYLVVEVFMKKSS